MTSIVKKKINNWLAFKMFIHIFTIVSDEWRDACDIQLIMGKDVGDDNETMTTPDSPKDTFTVWMKDQLEPRPWKPLNWCVMYESSPFKLYTCDFHPTGWRSCWMLPRWRPIGLTWPQIIKTTPGVAFLTLYAP